MENDAAKRKEEIRIKIWNLMEENKIARFPGAHGRIPNFIGADRAAGKVGWLDLWRKSNVVLCNPDSPQQPLRKLVLEKGKILYVAAPKLSKMKCFLELNPSKMSGKYDFASSIKGAFNFGKPVNPEDMRKPDFVVAGSVAVNKDGARVGKGGGFSDLEYAIAVQTGLVDKDTPIIATVHKLQVIDEEIPMEEHDIPIDIIITPDKTIETNRKFPKPKGIIWNLLNKEKIESIPILKEMKNG